MKKRLLGLMRKEFLQFFRDRSLVLLVLYTFTEIAICGWSLTLEARNLPLAVVDGDRTPESRSLVGVFARQDDFSLVESLNSPAEVEPQIDNGAIQVPLVIPSGFSRDLEVGRPTTLQLIVDGSNSNIAGQALAAAGDLVRDYNVKLAMKRLDRAGQDTRGWLPQVRNEIRVWYMPQLKYVHFVIVAMLAIAVLILGMLVPAAGIVREKEAGTLEQLMVTPIWGGELIAAKILPFMLLELVGLTIGIAMSLWLFGVPLRGSLVLFYAISLLMFLGSSGIGVLMGTVARNMQQALLLAFFILFPVAFLSGTMVPISNMPVFLQWLTYLSPLRYYVEAGLGIFLKGVGLDVLWPQALALGVLGLVLMTISTMRLRSSLS